MPIPPGRLARSRRFRYTRGRVKARRGRAGRHRGNARLRRAAARGAAEHRRPRTLPPAGRHHPRPALADQRRRDGATRSSARWRRPRACRTRWPSATAPWRWRSRAARSGLPGEVIVPSFTFVATAHALDVARPGAGLLRRRPRTHTIDPARAEDLVTPRTSAILGRPPLGRAPATSRACRRRRAPRPAPAVRRRARVRLRARRRAGFARLRRRGGPQLPRHQDRQQLRGGRDDHRERRPGRPAAPDAEQRLRGGRPRRSRVGINAQDDGNRRRDGAHQPRVAPALPRGERAELRGPTPHGPGGLPGVTLVDTGTSRAHVVAESRRGEAGGSRAIASWRCCGRRTCARAATSTRLPPPRALPSRDPDAGGRLPETERLCDRVLVLPDGHRRHAGRRADGVPASSG